MSTARATSSRHLLIKSLISQNGDRIDVGTITVLIGPSNSGKTEILRDVIRLATNLEISHDPPKEHAAGPPVILEDLTFVDRLTMNRLVDGLTQLPGGTDTEATVQGIGPDLATPVRRVITAELRNILHRPAISANAIKSTALADLMPLRFVYIDPRRRSTTARTAPCSPMQAPESLLQLLQDAPQSVHDELDQAFSAAFEGLHLRLDDSQRVQLHLRLADQFPPTAEDPLNTVLRFNDLRQLDQQGDGLLSYATVVLTMLLCQGRVVLIDQPSATMQHIHARQLGRWISDYASKLCCQVFLTSPDVPFLRGLFEGISDVTLVRLERRGDATQLYPITHEVGQLLARHPLLSSQSSLTCLFSEGIVLVPRDGDRAVYETVAQSLGANNLCFLHCHGTANLALVAQALSRTGLPLCVVAELDVFGDESFFVQLVQAVTGQAPPQPWLATRERLASEVEGHFDDSALSTTAKEVENFLDHLESGTDEDSSSADRRATDRARQLKWERLKTGQLDALPLELRTWVEEVLDDLRHKGIFISPKADARSWMSETLAVEKQEAWLIHSLEALHNRQCPADLQAFVADLVAQVRSLRLPARAARAGQRA